MHIVPNNFWILTKDLELMTKIQHQRHHLMIDMSNRHYSLCESDKIYIEKKNGRPCWYYLDDKLVCGPCYKKAKMPEKTRFFKENKSV